MGGEETHSTASAITAGQVITCNQWKEQKEKGLTLCACVITEGDVCAAGEAQECPSPDGSACSARNKKLLISGFAPEGTNKWVFVQGSLHREL